MQKISDGNHLEYLCENSSHRQRIICRRGKILPRNPICYQGCHVNNEDFTFSKTFYRHRENVYYQCNNNTLPSLINQTIRCINGNLSEQPLCHSSKSKKK